MAYNAQTNLVRLYVDNSATATLNTSGFHAFVTEMIACGMITATQAATDPGALGANAIWYKPDSGLASSGAPAGDSAVYRRDSTNTTWTALTPTEFATYIYTLAGGPSTATQAEVDAGTVSDKYVSPATLRNYTASYFYFRGGPQTIAAQTNTLMTTVSSAEESYIDASRSGGTITMGTQDAGVWHLSSNVVLRDTSQSCYTSINVNGSIAALGRVGSGTGGNTTLHPNCAVSMRLNAGDVVEFYAYSDEGSTSANVVQTSSAFSGVRISQ